MMRGFIVLLVVLGIDTGCPSPVTTAAIGAVVDCTVKDQDQLTALLAELKPLLGGQSPDWLAVYARAKQAGSVIGGCALAELAQDYLGKRALTASRAEAGARQTLERFRREEAGNATFHTARGDI
jgi:hypothetical protein